MEDKPDTKVKKKRVSKQDWLNKALEVLERSGIAAIRVERLASELNVAKSGFYYHFRDRADLFQAMLDAWVVLDHAPLRSLQDLTDASPREKLATVADVVERENLSRYDSAIRMWGRTDPIVARVWQAEMERRRTFVRSLFEEAGFTGEDLEMRVRLFTSYLVTEQEMISDLSASRRAELRKLGLELLIRKD